MILQKVIKPIGRILEKLDNIFSKYTIYLLFFAMIQNIKERIYTMKKITLLTILATLLVSFGLSGCTDAEMADLERDMAKGQQTQQYNSYNNDKQISSVIATEMNSLSDKDIAQLNTLK